ncbi:hypothetical protein EV175_002181 [Coemansia sp. RSA 1933]|nr:hypothetical protein EV175_002181 [Coemansia sp. RSA 1933]
MKPLLEKLDVPVEFFNNRREWAAFEAPSNPLKEQRYMPRELYFYERNLGIRTWYQPIDYVIPRQMEDVYELGKQWREEEKQKRREQARVRAKQDHPVKQRPMDDKWMRVETEQGRVYFYNKETRESTWDSPFEVDEEQEGTEFNAEDAEWMLAQMGGGGQEDLAEGTSEHEEDDDTQQQQKPSKDECVARFRQMLMDGSIDPFGSWDTQARRFQNDERAALISDDAERRDLFDSVCAQIIEQQRKDKEIRTRSNTNDPFGELLHEQVRKRMPFARFCEKNLGDPRYLAIKTSREREKRFTQFVDREYPSK